MQRSPGQHSTMTADCASAGVYCSTAPQQCESGRGYARREEHPQALHSFGRAFSPGVRGCGFARASLCLKASQDGGRQDEGRRESARCDAVCGAGGLPWAGTQKKKTCRHTQGSNRRRLCSHARGAAFAATPMAPPLQPRPWRRLCSRYVRSMDSWKSRSTTTTYFMRTWRTSYTMNSL